MMQIRMATVNNNSSCHSSDATTTAYITEHCALATNLSQNGVLGSCTNSPTTRASMSITPTASTGRPLLQLSNLRAEVGQFATIRQRLADSVDILKEVSAQHMYAEVMARDATEKPLIDGAAWGRVGTAAGSNDGAISVSAQMNCLKCHLGPCCNCQGVQLCVGQLIINIRLCSNKTLS